MGSSTSDSVRREGNTSYEYRKQPQSFSGQVEQFTHESGKRIGEVASRIADSATAQMRAGREYISENPVKGVAIAAATGALAGSLLTMVMRRRPPQ